MRDNAKPIIFSHGRFGGLFEGSRRRPDQGFGVIENGFAGLVGLAMNSIFHEPSMVLQVLVRKEKLTKPLALPAGLLARSLSPVFVDIIRSRYMQHLRLALSQAECELRKLNDQFVVRRKVAADADCVLADYLVGRLANRGSKTARSSVEGSGVFKSSGAAALWPLQGLQGEPLALFPAVSPWEAEAAVITEEVSQKLRCVNDGLAGGGASDRATLTDLLPELARIGELDGTFPVQRGARRCGEDCGKARPARDLRPQGTRDLRSDLHIDRIEVKTRDFP